MSRRQNLFSFVAAMVALLLLALYRLTVQYVPHQKVALLSESRTNALPSSHTVVATRASSLKPDARREAAVNAVDAVFKAPIEFYGKVQDQNGYPISDVKVDYSAINQFWRMGSKYRGTSDENGLFAISHIDGAGLTVA